MKKISKIGFIIGLLIVNSCNKNNKEYEILNDFIEINKIEITCLQTEPFCFKNLYLTDAEKKALNIDLKNDLFCNKKLI